ncbi:MAG: ABC transporter permease, partial [Shimia sp.]
MEPLTYTGSLGAILNPVMLALVGVAVIGILAQFVIPFVVQEQRGALAFTRGPGDYAAMAVQFAVLGIIAIIAIYVLAAIFGPYGIAGIVGEVGARFTPVWIALIVTFTLSIIFKRKLGLYGKLFDSPIGMVGFGLVMFWVFTAAFAGWIMTFDPLAQEVVMKNDPPGSPFENDGPVQHFLLGGDNLARDVFSRMVAGSQIVVLIAPLATLFAFMVGIVLGLPAGYFGGAFDTGLSFLANLILAFPVILLFYLLVTPEIVATGLPTFMAMVLFLFPIVFLVVLFNSRFFTQPTLNKILIGGTVVIGGILYLSLISDQGRPIPLWVDFVPEWLDLFDIPGGILIVFVSVVFVNSPTVFRIVRGLALDIQTRDYVAAAQTRGEGPWYIMLWEILPNARGPLIVDFCLRIGYTTI